MSCTVLESNDTSLTILISLFFLHTVLNASLWDVPYLGTLFTFANTRILATFAAF